MIEENKSIKQLFLIKNVHLLRIVLLLAIHQNLSLTELSSILNRTKATISHHLKKLERGKVITITKKEVKGSIDAHIYALSPSFYRFFRDDYDLIFKEKPENIERQFNHLAIILLNQGKLCLRNTILLLSKV